MGRESRSVHERTRGPRAAVAAKERRRIRREAHSHTPRRRLPPRRMTIERQRPAGVPQSLGRLRLRLTAWYVGTFLIILLLLGVGMFAAITRRFDSELDASLRDATRELAKVVQARG